MRTPFLFWLGTMAIIMPIFIGAWIKKDQKDNRCKCECINNEEKNER